MSDNKVPSNNTKETNDDNKNIKAPIIVLDNSVCLSNNSNEFDNYDQSLLLSEAHMLRRNPLNDPSEWKDCKFSKKGCIIHGSEKEWMFKYPFHACRVHQALCPPPW